MIVVTGAAGFIGSCLVSKLNSEGFHALVLVDDFNIDYKKPNWQNKQHTALVSRESFFDWLDDHHRNVEFIFHIGARTDTTLFDIEIFNHLNLHYSQTMWNKCCAYGIPLIYASSAATYGDGSLGYSDSHQLVENLEPLNPYGNSKNDFDKWALLQPQQPYFWVGLKFFNVYGPNEYHKGRMASVIFHAYHQIKNTGVMKLFASHNPAYADGGQMRDFVYVRDVADVLYWLLHHRSNSGIYNLGSGVARTFNDLVRSVFEAMQIKPNIKYIPTPEDIRDKYQYYTQADMSKLRSVGYLADFTTLEAGTDEYVRMVLKNDRYI